MDSIQSKFAVLEVIQRKGGLIVLRLVRFHFAEQFNAKLPKSFTPNCRKGWK